MRVAILGNAMSTMVRFRMALCADLRSRGHEVIAICPEGSPEDRATLCAVGVRHVPLLRMRRSGLEPLAELATLDELTRILRRERPDRLLSCFLKPVIWGALAARRAGVPRSIGMIEGLGYAFSRAPQTLCGRAKRFVVRQAMLALLRPALARLDHLIVMNDDDARMLAAHASVPSDRLTRIDGIGVDLSDFSCTPPPTRPIRFTMASRLLHEKGVALFALAAEGVRSRAPHVTFTLLGGLDDAPGAIDRRQVDAWVSRGVLKWHGHVSDVRPHLQKTSVFVLPTLYREGLPRSVMEAMAIGRPVVTSDMPGAYQSITAGQSGLIHRAGDLDSLVEACMLFVDDPALVTRMGGAARKEAERRYDLAARTSEQVKLILNV